MKLTLATILLSTLCAAQYQVFFGITQPTQGTTLTQGQAFNLTVAIFGSKAIGSVELNVSFVSLTTQDFRSLGNFRDSQYRAEDPRYVTIPLNAPMDLGTGPLNITVNDIVGTESSDGTITVDPYEQLTYTRTINVVAAPATPSTGITFGITSPPQGSTFTQGQTFDLVVKVFGSKAVGSVAVNVSFVSLTSGNSQGLGTFKYSQYKTEDNLSVRIPVTAPSDLGTGSFNLTVDDIVGIQNADGSITVDSYVTPVYTTTIRIVSASAGQASSSLFSTGATTTLTCGAGDAVCNDVRNGPVCYATQSYNCVDDPAGSKVLCHKPDQSCGTWCYDISKYSCRNNALVQL